jgi:superfamily II DNA or RNA helicase
MRTAKMAKKAKPTEPASVPTASSINRRGYGITKTPENEALIEELKATLTVQPKINPSMPNAEEGMQPFPTWRENSTKLYLPRCFGLERFGAPAVDDLSFGANASGVPAVGLIFNGGLRDNQVEPVNAYIEAANDPCRRGGLLVLGCAHGKTCCALYISTIFKKKTLVVCHKEFLMNQWAERIEQFIPTARIGRIKQAKVDIEDKDIVIASLQSIAMREYDRDLFKCFGIVIVDECHHISAEIFSRALPKITAPIMLGLTATPNRKDGLRKVFEWFLGKPVFEIKKRTDTDLKVIMREFYDCDPDYSREHKMMNRKPNVARMINNIAGYGPRNEVILDVLEGVLAEEPMRRTLIISDRRAHLETLAKLIAERGWAKTTGFYLGGMKQADLDASNTKDIILGTTTMIAEGYDNAGLNTLILATPLSSVEQAVGRVQRQKPEDRQYTPIVIDIWDQFSMFFNQGKRRNAFYKKNGYDVSVFNFVGDLCNGDSVS